MVKTVVQCINNLIKPHVTESHSNFLRSESLLYLGNVLLATWWCICTFQHRGNGIFQQNRKKFDIRRRSDGLVHVVTWLEPIRFLLHGIWMTVHHRDKPEAKGKLLEAMNDATIGVGNGKTLSGTSSSMCAVCWGILNMLQKH
jgi:hypothetical protein